MKVAVLVKVVPNTTKFEFNKETNTLVRSGEQIINPDDLKALALAQKLNQDIEVISMAPLFHKPVLSSVFAYKNVKKLIILSDPAFSGSDTAATAKVLAEFLKTQNYAYIFAGYQALDGDTAQVGPSVSTLLDTTLISCVYDITKKASSINAYLNSDFSDLEVRIPKKSLITVTSKQATSPVLDLANLSNLNDENIQTYTNQDLKIEITELGLKGSPTRVKKTFLKTFPKKSTEVLKVDTDTTAIILTNQFKEFLK